MGDEQMGDEQDPAETENSSRPRGTFNLAAFLIAFLFIWLVFDNFALALLFGLIFAGGSEVAQRAATRKTD